MRLTPANSFALSSRCVPLPVPSKGTTSSGIRTRSLLQLCALLLLERGVQGQEKPALEGATRVATNLNAGAVSGAEHTNTPAGLFGGSTVGGAQVPVNLRPFQLVLPREHLFGDWFGLRSKAKETGISPTVTFVTDIAGNVTGGKSQGVTHADNLGLDLLFDLDKLIGLEGGSFLASVSQRSGSSLSSEHIGNVFAMNRYTAGRLSI